MRSSTRVGGAPAQGLPGSLPGRSRRHPAGDGVEAHAASSRWRPVREPGGPRPQPHRTQPALGDPLGRAPRWPFGGAAGGSVLLPICSTGATSRRSTVRAARRLCSGRTHSPSRLVSPTLIWRTDCPPSRGCQVPVGSGQHRVNTQTNTDVGQINGNRLVDGQRPLCPEWTVTGRDRTPRNVASQVPRNPTG